MNNGLSELKHVVVLMFENRSFDHVFGALPGVNGVLNESGNYKKDLYNLFDPTQPPSLENLPVTLQGIDLWEQSSVITHDFNHDFCDGMMPDLFGPGTTGYKDGKPIGAPAKTWPATNSGFVSTRYDPHSPRPTGRPAMTYFNLGQLQVLHGLAQEFVVCDNWFCDMPGHTMPNRVFMHCAQTDNLKIDDRDKGSCDAKTIFQLLNELGRDWAIYSPPCGQTDARFLSQINGKPNTNLCIQQLNSDIRTGSLPFYSFVMCWSGGQFNTDTSMHPASFMEPGENLLAAVYDALLSSPIWNETLLVVNFDENGGIYDHVPPPPATPPKPGLVVHQDFNGIKSEFDFSVLGPRIPALLISPWLSPGVDSTQYQNTSVLRFLEDLAAPTPLQVFLTDRDKTANSIARAFDQFGLTEPRTDCPTMPRYPGFPFTYGLSDPMCNDDPSIPLAPHMAEVAKIYGAG